MSDVCPSATLLACVRFTSLFPLYLEHSGPHTTTACVLILLSMCPHTDICVLILLYMCPHTTIYGSSYCYMYMCSYCYISVSAYHYILMHVGNAIGVHCYVIFLTLFFSSILYSIAYSVSRPADTRIHAHTHAHTHMLTHEHVWLPLPLCRQRPHTSTYLLYL